MQIIRCILNEKRALYFMWKTYVSLSLFSEAIKSGSIGDVKQVVVTFGRVLDVPR
jgi:hypothetical protein